MFLYNFEQFWIFLPPWTQCCNGELSVSVLSTRRRQSPRIPSFKECDPAMDSKRFVEVTSSHVSACFSFLRRPRLRGPPLWERDTSCFNSCGKLYFHFLSQFITHRLFHPCGVVCLSVQCLCLRNLNSVLVCQLYIVDLALCNCIPWCLALWHLEEGR